MLFWGIIILVILVQIIILMYGKITDLQDKNAVLQREKEILLKRQPRHSNIVPERLKINYSPMIEKEIRTKFPELSDYLDNLFTWFHKEVSENPHFAEGSDLQGIKNVSAKWALLFFQISEQLKYSYGGSEKSEWLEKELQKMYPLWDFLLNRLTEYNYYTMEEASGFRLEMDAHIKNGGLKI